MDHAVLKEKVFALYDGELSGEERQQVGAHLQECAECRGRVERWTAVAKVFFKEPRPLASEFFVQRVMDRIGLLNRPRPALQWNIAWRWLVPALGATAALLLMLNQPAQRAVSIETLLLGNTEEPVSWMLLSDQKPTKEEVLGFALEG